MMNLEKKFQSVRVKLFITLFATIVTILAFLLLMNSVVLETYYMYSKESILLGAYKSINSYYNGTMNSANIELELEKLSVSNDFDILIKTDTSIYTSSRDFISTLIDVENSNNKKLDENLLFVGENVKIKKTIDKQTQLSYILLSATLDNGYELYIRSAIASMQMSAKFANRFLMAMGSIAVIISGVVVLVISKKFTSPIEELNKITAKISELDFSHKYCTTDSQDEINNLRKKY